MLVETAVGSSMTPALAEGARHIRQAEVEAITKAGNVMGGSGEVG
jgi:hypothetical protein